MERLSSEPQSFNRYTDVASWLHWAARADPSYSSRAVPDVLQLLRKQFYFWWKPRQAAQNCSYQTGSPSTDHRPSLPGFRIKQLSSVLLFVVLTLNSRCYFATLSLGLHRLVKQMQNHRYLLVLFLKNIFQRTILKYYYGLIIVLSCNIFAIIKYCRFIHWNRFFGRLILWHDSGWPLPRLFRQGLRLGNRCDPEVKQERGSLGWWLWKAVLHWKSSLQQTFKITL